MSETSEGQLAWFIRHGSEDESSEVEQLAESELHRVLRRAGDKLRGMYVRQGNSDWYPAKVVLKKFEKLATEGIYLRADDGFVDGPFTAVRALEMLIGMGDLGGASAKVGIHSDWVPARRLLKVLRRNQAPDQASDEDSDLNDEEEHVAEFAAVMEEYGRQEVVEAEAEVVEAEPLIELVMVAEPVTLPQQPAESDEFTPQPRISARRSSSRKDQSESETTGSGRGKKILMFAVAACLLCLVVGGVMHLFDDPPTEAAAESQRHETEVSTTVLSAPVTRPAPEPAAVESRPPSESFPKLRPAMLFRPSIQTTMGDVNEGVLFAARVGRSKRTVLVGAANQLGPEYGLRRQLRGAEVLLHFQQMQLTDCVTKKPRAFSGKPLRLKTAEYPSISIHGDVVVFEPDDRPKLDPLLISSRIPEKGERVWVLSLAADGDSLVHAARFVRADGDWLHLRMDEPQTNTKASIGGAVVNSDLAVIGVKVTDIEGDDGVITVASPIQLIIHEIQ